MEKEYITRDGVTIFYDGSPQLHSFCLSLYVRAGSMYENKKNNGISHFFEHIVFRNIHHIMGNTLYQTLDRLGLVFNAVTYKEFMMFYITGAPRHFLEAAEILTKIMRPLDLPAEEIDTERKRIKAEIREEDEESSLSHYAKQKIWKKTSLAYPIAGTKKNLDQIGKDELNAFQKEALTADCIFYYVTGHFKEEDIRHLAGLTPSFPGMNPGKRKGSMAPRPERFFHRKPKVYVKEGDKTSVCIGIDIDAEKYTYAERQLLYDILFEGDFCKVFQALSEKKGYVYSYDSWLEEYPNLANLRLCYEVQPKNLCSSVEEVFSIFRSLKEGIGDALSYVRAAYIDNAHFTEDDVEDYNWMMAYENHILGLHYKKVEDRMEEFRSVSSERMTQICREIFCSENIVLAIEGKKKQLDLEELEKIRRSF